MPLPLLEAYLREIPRLHAAQLADGAVAVSVGMAGKEGQRVLRDWQQQAAGDPTGGTPVRPSGNGRRIRADAPGAMAAMVAMGIKVEVV